MAKSPHRTADHRTVPATFLPHVNAQAPPWSFGALELCPHPANGQGAILVQPTGIKGTTIPQPIRALGRAAWSRKRARKREKEEKRKRKHLPATSVQYVPVPSPHSHLVPPTGIYLFPTLILLYLSYITSHHITYSTSLYPWTLQYHSTIPIRFPYPSALWPTTPIILSLRMAYGRLYM